MHFTVIVLSFLTIFVNFYVNAAPIKDVDETLNARNYSPEVQPPILARQGSTLHGLWAQFCDQDGKNCSEWHSMFTHECFREDVKSNGKIRIRSNPKNQSQTFELNSAISLSVCKSHDHTMFDGNSQKIVKPYDGQLIGVSVKGPWFHFDIN